MKNKENNKIKLQERRLAVAKLETIPKYTIIEMKKDIIIKKRCSDIVEYDEKGNKIIKPRYKKVNLTKLVNETKKLVKRDLALEKIEELKKVMESK